MPVWKYLGLGSELCGVADWLTSILIWCHFLPDLFLFLTGVVIETLLSSWGDKYEMLEENHSYIQW